MQQQLIPSIWTQHGLCKHGVRRDMESNREVLGLGNLVDLCQIPCCTTHTSTSVKTNDTQAHTRKKTSNQTPHPRTW